MSIISPITTCKTRLKLSLSVTSKLVNLNLTTYRKHKKKRHRKRKHESESSAVESERENRNPQVQPQPYTPISHECTVNYDYDPSSLHTMKGSRAFRLPASSIAPSQKQSQASYLAPS